MSLLKRYRLEGKIGEGTYGMVYKAKKLKRDLSEEEDDYAIKMIKPSSNEIERPSVTSISTLREISLLRELSHDNLVDLTDVVIDPKERDVALVMDFAAWTLDSVIKHHGSTGKKISPYMCKAMIYQLLKGLEYLHENWVMHRDLKPQNILIIGRGTKRGRLQLADLGLARIFRAPVLPLGQVDKTVVTLWYRAPELLLGSKHYTAAVDVWSMGCIFAELYIAHRRRPPHAAAALFPGKQASGKPAADFEEDQSRKVFSVVGLPTQSSWPEGETLPHFGKLLELRKKAQREKSDAFGPTATLKKHLEKESAHYCNGTAMGLLQEMLELSPSKRISAKDALDHMLLRDFVRQHPHCGDNALDENLTHKPVWPDYPIEPPKPLDKKMQDAQAETHRQLKAALRATTVS